MTEEQIKTSQLLNDFRSRCRKENIKFTSEEFRRAAAFGNLPKDALKWLLKALVERKYVMKEGSTRHTTYWWTPLYRNEDTKEEYAAINPNSWETLFKKMSDLRSTVKRSYLRKAVVESTITVASAIAFLKKNCPTIRIIEKFKKADGTEFEQEY